MAKKKKKKHAKKTGFLSILVLLVALGVFLFSAGKLVMIYLEYKAGEDEYEQIREFAQADIEEEENVLAGEGFEDALKPPKIDFDALQAENPDIVGWIKIEGLEKINYPIMQGEDNSYYLTHTFEGTTNNAGSIFMEMYNSPDFNDCHTVLYGHNMKNDSMFGTLADIGKEGMGYEVSPYFWICTPDGCYLYEIFAAYKTKATGDTYTLFSDHGADFGMYVTTMKERSELAAAAEVTQDDKVITLSTCTASSDIRFVVQGKRLPEVYLYE